MIRHQADLIKHLHEQLEQQRKKQEAPKNLATGPNAEPPNINGTPMPSASTGFDLIVLLFIVIFFSIFALCIKECSYPDNSV